MVHFSWRALSVWLGLTLAALWLDQPLAAWVHASGFYLVAKDSILAGIIKIPGTASFIIALLLVSWLYPPRRAGEAVMLVTAGAASGLFYSLIKWTVGRDRPIGGGVFNIHPFELHPFEGGLSGLFISRPDQSFPSGHVSLAFAVALVLGLYYPRGRLLFFGIAALVAIERVLEDAHYLSDVIAATGIGIIAATSAAHLCKRYLDC